MSSVPCNEDLGKIYRKMEFQLGELISKGDKTYQFIQYNDGGDHDVDGYAGRLVIGLDTGYGANEVTMDFSATITDIPKAPKGFLQAALTHATYGWIQTWGPNSQSMLTDGGVAQGDVLMKHPTINGAVDTRPSAETGAVAVLDVFSVGVAREADDGNNLLTAGRAFIRIRST